MGNDYFKGMLGSIYEEFDVTTHEDGKVVLDLKGIGPTIRELGLMCAYMLGKGDTTLVLDFRSHQEGDPSKAEGMHRAVLQHWRGIDHRFVGLDVPQEGHVLSNLNYPTVEDALE